MHTRLVATNKFRLVNVSGQLGFILTDSNGMETNTCNRIRIINELPEYEVVEIVEDFNRMVEHMAGIDAAPQNSCAEMERPVHTFKPR